MTNITHLFEGGTDGNGTAGDLTLTNFNASSANGDPLTTVNLPTGASITYDDSQAQNGSNLGVTLVGGASSTYIGDTFTQTDDDLTVRLPFLYPSGTATGENFWVSIRNSSGTQMSALGFNAAGTKLLRPFIASTGQSGSASPALTANTWYWLELYVKRETGAGGNGIVSYRIYAADGTTVVYTAAPITNAATGTVVPGQIRWYPIQSSNPITTVGGDTLRAVSGLGLGTWIGTYSKPAPVADAGTGSGATILAPWTTVTLNGSGVAATGNTITGYRWRRVSGPVSSLTDTTSPSPTAEVRPSGTGNATTVFGLTVTDSDGVQSAEATVSYTVGAADVYDLSTAGSWTPVRELPL